MSTAIIDYEQLNDAAQVLYQEAHRRGLGEGEEKGRRECADWHMRGNIDLAEQMLRRAANVEIEDEAQALAIFARMLLSRTPLMHPAISETLSLLRDSPAARPRRPGAVRSVRREAPGGPLRSGRLRVVSSAPKPGVRNASMSLAAFP